MGWPGLDMKSAAVEGDTVLSPSIALPLSIALLMSLAAKPASIAMDAAVPNPGTKLTAPDASSRAAPAKSPFIALCKPNPIPANKPIPGIFLSNDFPIAFAPNFAPNFAEDFPAALPPIIAADFPAALPPCFAS